MDIMFVGMLVVFFALCYLLVSWCDREIGTNKGEKEQRYGDFTCNSSFYIYVFGLCVS